jgi:hypothetical protein
LSTVEYVRVRDQEEPSGRTGSELLKFLREATSSKESIAGLVAPMDLGQACNLGLQDAPVIKPRSAFFAPLKLAIEKRFAVELLCF